MTPSWKELYLAGAFALLGCADANSMVPWTPQNVREELSVYEDIVVAQVIEEDRDVLSAEPTSETCETTYAVAVVTKVLKGARLAGERILLGRLHSNFPLASGSEHILLLQRDLGNDDILNDHSYECPKSELLRRATGEQHPFSGVYTGYSDFEVRHTNGLTTVAVWAYQGRPGWMFLDDYSFDRSVAADGDRGGTLEITPYDKFITHIDRTLAEIAKSTD